MYPSAAIPTITTIVSVSAIVLGFFLVAVSFYLQHLKEFYSTLDWMRYDTKKDKERKLILVSDLLGMMIVTSILSGLALYIVMHGLDILRSMPEPGNQLTELQYHDVIGLTDLFGFYLLLLPILAVLLYFFGLKRSIIDAEYMEEEKERFFSGWAFGEMYMGLAHEAYANLSEKLRRPLTTSEKIKEWDDFVEGKDCEMNRILKRRRNGIDIFGNRVKP